MDTKLVAKNLLTQWKIGEKDCKLGRVTEEKTSQPGEKQ